MNEMLAWQFENEFTHETFTLSDAQIRSLKIDIDKWAKEHGYHCVKSFEIEQIFVSGENDKKEHE